MTLVAFLIISASVFLHAGWNFMPSIYWNQVHGAVADDALLDEEGLATMRMLAKNMVFLMESIALGKEKFGLPQKEGKVRTNFIRR